MNGSDQPTQVRGIRRVVYIAIAFLCLALGLLGAVVPGLPTTPFLLLTSYFLVRASPWLHDRVMRMPLVGRLVVDWREHRGIRPRVKLIAYLMVLAVVGVTLASPTLRVSLKVTIAVLAAIGIGVVWRLPTIEPEAAKPPRGR